jgi:hypothetical protein
MNTFSHEKLTVVIWDMGLTNPFSHFDEVNVFSVVGLKGFGEMHNTKFFMMT